MMTTHNDTIVDQFTRQAVPFAQKQEHSNAEANRIILESLALDKADNLLDVACGPGLTACAFAPLVNHVTGIDLTPAMLDGARKRADEHGLTNVSWQAGDVSNMPFADGSFSVVFSRYAFHHFSDPQRVLAEMARICAPGGRVVVADVYADNPAQGNLFDLMEIWRDPSHVHALLLTQWRDLFQQSALKLTSERMYRLEMELEAQLRVSFHNPGDERKIRAAMATDIGRNESGFSPRREGSEIRFSYPVVVMRGEKIS
jgi:ubiquinone/menaquinone biosynthesis C-methylase UbiE